MKDEPSGVNFVTVKNILSIVFLVCLSFATLAGTGDKGKATSRTVAGKVTDQSGESVSGARITVKETGDVFFSDLEGNFNFTLKTDKVYSLSVETIGYQPKELRSSELSYFSELSLSEL